MLRQFLTLLALVTGLAAVAEPVQARSAGIENVAQAEQASACFAVSGQIAAVMLAVDQGEMALAVPADLAPAVAHVPAVILQADRAHE